MNRTPEEIIDLFGISDEERECLSNIKDPIMKEMPRVIADFYSWMESQSEYEEYFTDRELLASVREKQAKDWEMFFDASFAEEYYQRREHIGEVHARIGLPIDIYMAGMDRFLSLFIGVVDTLDMPDDAYNKTRRALNKMIHLDCTLTILSYDRLVNERIAAQSKSLIAMSTPVTQIWDGVLLLPLVGIIDSKRAQDIMDTTLEKIQATSVRTFILDISGVAVVDSAVANHLIKITKATRMMGCESIISGVSPGIAQTIVDLGIDVGDIRTTGDMRTAMEIALARIEMVIAPKSGRGANGDSAV